MIMRLSEIINVLENFASPYLQENYDNATLIVGDYRYEISSALISLDCTEEIVDEAIKVGANLIISHHPIVFKGLKSLTGKNYVERTIIKAIKNNIAIYAMHTNLDNVKGGVNYKIADKLGLENCKILSPKSGFLRKLVFFVPVNASQMVQEALFKASAGNIGNYDECSFSVEGTGSFRANDSANPTIGEKNKRHFEKENRVEVIFNMADEKKILKALMGSHPYEEVAYDIYQLENRNQDIGSGIIGELKKETDAFDFLNEIKRVMQADGIRYTKPHKKVIKKVAICGGSGSFLLSKAIANEADIFITADFKYHEFFDAENKIIIADIGHFESEQYTKELFMEILQKKIPNFATHLSSISTNPINYL